MTQSIHQALLLFLCLLTFLTPSLGQQYQAGDIYPHFGTNGKLRIFEAEGNLNPQAIIGHISSIRYALTDEDKLFAAVICREYGAVDSPYYVHIYRYLPNGQVMGSCAMPLTEIF